MVLDSFRYVIKISMGFIVIIEGSIDHTIGCELGSLSPVPEVGER
jgi:hypothetical protein